MGKALGLVSVAVLLLAGCGGKAAERQAPPKGDPERGKQVYLSLGCFNCHTLKAANAPRDRHIGPNLELVAEMYDAAFIRESIENPRAYIENGRSGSIGGEREYPVPMPAWGPGKDSPRDLTEQQIVDLVAFIESSASS